MRTQCITTALAITLSIAGAAVLQARSESYGVESHGSESYGSESYGEESYGADSYGAGASPAEDKEESHGGESYGADSYDVDTYGTERSHTNDDEDHGANSYGADSYGADSFGAESYGANSYGSDPRHEESSPWSAASLAHDNWNDHLETADWNTIALADSMSCSVRLIHPVTPLTMSSQSLETASTRMERF